MRRHAIVALLLLAPALAACPDTSSLADDAPARVDIDPSVVRLEALGATTKLTATVLTLAGVPIEDASVEWSSSNTQVASVSGTGVVTATGVGETTITASTEAGSDAATVIVEQTITDVRFTTSSVRINALQDAVQLSAVAYDAEGNVVPGATMGWFQLDGSSVSLSGDATVTAQAPGVSHIMVYTGGEHGPYRTDTLAVTVEQVASSVVVSPSARSIVVGDTAHLAVAATDSNGYAIASPSVDWTSSAPGVASVDTAGVVTGQFTGTATITATSGPASGSAQITVEQGVITSVVVSPTSASLTAGETQQFTATTYDDQGNAVTWAEVSWQSSDATVASVDGTGLVTANAAGSALIIATSQTVADTATVTVTSGTIITSFRGCSTVANYAIGQTVGGALETTDCTYSSGTTYYVDYYAFTVDATQTITIDQTAGFDTYLYLFDSSENLLTTDDDSGDGLNSRITYTVQPGTYVIAAGSYSAGVTGSYTLSSSGTAATTSYSVTELLTLAGGYSWPRGITAAESGIGRIRGVRPPS